MRLMRYAGLMLVASMAMLVGACATDTVRTDTVAHACEDVGALFSEGLEYRLAGAAASEITEQLVERGADPLTARSLTAEIMAQVLPRAQKYTARYLADAQRIAAEACRNAQTQPLPGGQPTPVVVAPAA